MSIYVIKNCNTTQFNAQYYYLFESLYKILHIWYLDLACNKLANSNKFLSVLLIGDFLSKGRVCYDYYQKDWPLFFTSSIAESNIMSIVHHNRFVTDTEMEG